VRKRRVDAFFEVTNADVERTKQETGEDDDRLRHIENLLEQWMRCVDHLPHDYDATMARNFIRGSKFHLETAKRKFEGYFLAKHAFPELYHQRDPALAELRRVFDVVNIVWLPRLTEKGERICILSLAEVDPDVLDVGATLKVFWMIYDLLLTCQFPVSSIIMIFDCNQATAKHIGKLFNTSFKHSFSLLRDAYAIRISQLHVLNCPPMVEKLISVVRPLMHEKVKKRFAIHRDTDWLVKNLHAKVLPSDYGGNLESVRDYMGMWKEIMMENSDWFRAQENVKIVGTPPKKIERFINNIGIEGSFRQLNID
jgi:hypothetical protein